MTTDEQNFQEAEKENCARKSEAEKRFLMRSILFAAAILTAALGVKLLSAAGIANGDALARALGAGIGVVFIVLGNAMPKTLGILSNEPEREAKTQTRQRRTGWLFVLAGIAIIAGWLALPVGGANFFMMALTLAIVVFITAQRLSKRRKS